MKNFKKMAVLKLFFILIMIFSCSSPEKSKELVTLKYKILDSKTQKPIPGKLIFLQNNQEVNLNLPDQFGIAPENNGFYTAAGVGEVKIPAGDYTIYASRGLEYSIDKKEISLPRDASSEQIWTIQREIDPVGYVGCDFHLHTLNSDGNCTEAERVTSLVGEGVEFAVATDHNFITNYHPAIDSLGVADYITTCSGDELTTDIGHFNIFPLPPDLKPFDPKPLDARALFGAVRALPGPIVVQISHPRWDGIDYFGIKDLNFITGESENPTFSWDFNSMEIMNEPTGWGIQTGGSNYYSVWEEWFNLLNKGFRVTGVGNTDSHTLLKMPNGWPRNYIASTTDDPAAIQVAEITQNIIAHRVSVSRGLFVNLIVNGQPIGSEVAAADGNVELAIEVLAPSWIKADKVIIYANGREIWSEAIHSQANTPTRFQKRIQFQPEVDTWYLVKAEGSQNLWPIVPKQGEIDITPLGFTNPVWVDIDKNGFQTERDRARLFLKACQHNLTEFSQKYAEKDWWFQRQVLAVVEKNSALELTALKSLFNSESSSGRRYAFKRLGEIGNTNAAQLLTDAKQYQTDPNDLLLIDAYLSRMVPGMDKAALINRAVPLDDQRLRLEIVKILSTGQYQKEWFMAGPFDNENDKGLETPFAPENGVDLADEYQGKNNQLIKWQKITANQAGYIDLTSKITESDQCVAYAYLTIDSPAEMKTVLIFGSDDGAAIWHNQKEIFRKFIRRSANPHDELIPVVLTQGENTFLVKDENGGGDWGFYLQIFDPDHLLSQK